MHPRNARPLAAWALAATVGLLTVVGPARATDDDIFSIAKDTTGHLIPQNKLVSAVPINKRYEQMSPAQQALLRNLYDNMPADDEPPFPKDGLRWIFTEFEKAAHRAAVDGELLLTVTVDSKGAPQEVKVYRTPQADVAQAAAFLLMKETYKPGKCHGQPCRMDYLFDVNLVVNRELK